MSLGVPFIFTLQFTLEFTLDDRTQIQTKYASNLRGVLRYFVHSAQIRAHNTSNLSNYNWIQLISFNKLVDAMISSVVLRGVTEMWVQISIYPKRTHVLTYSHYLPAAGPGATAAFRELLARPRATTRLDSSARADW